MFESDQIYSNPSTHTNMGRFVIVWDIQHNAHVICQPMLSLVIDKRCTYMFRYVLLRDARVENESRYVGRGYLTVISVSMSSVILPRLHINNLLMENVISQ